VLKVNVCAGEGLTVVCGTEVNRTRNGAHEHE
jgi:hypothetical protein